MMHRLGSSEPDQKTAMKTKTSKQAKQSKRPFQLKDIKPKRDATGGRRSLVTTLSMDLDRMTSS